MSSPAPARIDVTRTHLELRAIDEFRPVRALTSSASVHRLRPVSAAQYRALYGGVGAQWLWRDRLVWSDDELETYLASPNIHVWVLTVATQTAGYFELQHHPNDTVELMYFGLVPAFIGQGLGGWLLTCAVEEAFSLGASRMILNTCSLDAPHALPNYLARGFTIVREERYTVDLPERSAAESSTAGAHPSS